jgi:hypothetical protein
MLVLFVLFACRPVEQHLYGGGTATVGFDSLDGEFGWAVEVQGYNQDVLDRIGYGEGIGVVSGAYSLSDELGDAAGADDNWSVYVNLDRSQVGVIAGLPCGSPELASFAASAEQVGGSVKTVDDSARPTESTPEAALPAELRLAGSVAGPAMTWEFHDRWTCEDDAVGVEGRLWLSWSLDEDVHTAIRAERSDPFTLPSGNISSH